MHAKFLHDMNPVTVYGFMVNIQQSGNSFVVVTGHGQLQHLALSGRKLLRYGKLAADCGSTDGAIKIMQWCFFCKNHGVIYVY